MRSIRHLTLALPLALACGLAAAATPPAKPNVCGRLEWNYGPFDYRSASAQQRELVEARHMNPELYAVSVSDLDYTLSVFPNHPGALVMMRDTAAKAKADRAPQSRYTLVCWFERALRFQPNDAVPRMLYVDFLLRRNEIAEARTHLDYVVGSNPDNPLTQFNAGMLYLDMKAYDKALVQAHRVLAMGLDRPELKQRLMAAGQWVEPVATAADSPASR